MVKDEMSEIHRVPSDESITTPVNEKNDTGEDRIEVSEDVAAVTKAVRQGEEITPEMRSKVAQLYGNIADKDNTAPQRDVEHILEFVVNMTDEEATDILVNAIAFHGVSGILIEQHHS